MLARNTVYLFLQEALLNNISSDSPTLKEITNSIHLVTATNEIQWRSKTRIELSYSLYLISRNFILRITGVIRTFQLSKFISAVSQCTLQKEKSEITVDTLNTTDPFLISLNSPYIHSYFNLSATATTPKRPLTLTAKIISRQRPVNQWLTNGVYVVVKN